MDRRDSLRVMLLAAVGSHRLLGRPTATAAQEEAFASRWHEWPDVRWAGPEYWGNRLQDWRIADGRAVCDVRGRDRTLHCLTHRVEGTSYRTAVVVDRVGPSLGGDRDAIVGFRCGLKGRFDDPRSAAVHGVGLDAGIGGDGRLRLGERHGSRTLPVDGPLRLVLETTPSGAGARLTLTAGPEDGADPWDRIELDGLPPEAVVGNLALLCHAPNGDSGSACTFDGWHASGTGLAADPSATFGPIMFAQYTVHRRVLKLTAQLAPIDDLADLRAVLEFEGATGWSPVAEVPVDGLSRTARFRVEGWDATRPAPYRVRVSIPLASGLEDFSFAGTIAAEPSPNGALRAAVFSCNADHGFPDAEVVRHVSKHAPDVAFFLGDQFYEGSGGFGIQTDSVEAASLDMLHKWYMFGWSYRDLFRHVPCAFLPDDHDVYHGNVWGEGGKLAPTDEGWGAVAQDQGGYKMPAEWVNAVQRAQTSHLPDAYDPTPVEQGIGVYYTRWDYAGVSFALLEDRKFKSAPANVLPPEAEVLNGWIQNPDFDVRDHRDPPGAALLGARQMRFLEDWARDWSGPSYLKVVMSQTNFAAVHTIPSDATSGAVLPSLPMPAPGVYVEGDKLAVDMDSNGWPQARRDEVLRILRSCSAFHIAGDQHLATVVRHGIEAFDDAGFSFTGPALNNIWPRRWWPPLDTRVAPLDAEARRRPEHVGRVGDSVEDPAYAGRFFDGFGNRITVHASANPRDTGLEPAIIRDRVTGYGIVTFDTGRLAIRIECWPRHVDPEAPDARPYEGWPLEISRNDGDGRDPLGSLQPVEVVGVDDATVEVHHESGELVYARRLRGRSARLAVFRPGTHTIRVSGTEEGPWQERVIPDGAWGTEPIRFALTP